ncbi:MAG TPA: IS1595 family transposase [Dehalococcoidia bacterium]|nr:IS1595 family transposase [Dehalococcoidia bacterium]
MKEPTTLLEAVRYFSDADTALEFMAALRWPDGIVICPNCGSDEVRFIPTRKLWECKAKHAKRQFSIKVGTIFEDSPLGLDKWLPAVWIIANDKNGISSAELARAVGVTQKSAWFMLHRIRLAMQTGTFRRMSGTVEVDETFIGGKSRFMHKDARARKIIGTGGAGKAAVMGLLERHGPDGYSVVKTKVIANVRRKTMSPIVREHVKEGAELFTDAFRSYRDLSDTYVHETIDHAEEYVRGKVHTNGIEDCWSLLKRSIKGTYVSVEPFHLFRYLDEQAFRYNARKTTDGVRFMRVLAGIIGKRITYAELTGKASPASV